VINLMDALRRSVATEKSSGAKTKRSAARPAATARRTARTPARRTGTRRAG
jgi:non-homologous end joining protein Ku